MGFCLSLSLSVCAGAGHPPRRLSSRVSASAAPDQAEAGLSAFQPVKLCCVSAVFAVVRKFQRSRLHGQVLQVSSVISAEDHSQQVKPFFCVVFCRFSLGTSAVSYSPSSPCVVMVFLSSRRRSYSPAPLSDAVARSCARCCKSQPFLSSLKCGCIPAY